MSSQFIKHLLDENYNTTESDFLEALDTSERTGDDFANDVKFLLNIRELQDAAIAYVQHNVLNRVTSVPVIVEKAAITFFENGLAEVHELLLSDIDHYIEAFTGPGIYSETALIEAVDRAYNAYTTYTSYISPRQNTTLDVADQQLIEDLQQVNKQLYMALNLYQQKLNKGVNGLSYFPLHVNRQDWREECNNKRTLLKRHCLFYADAQKIEDDLFLSVNESTIKTIENQQEVIDFIRKCVQEFPDLLTSIKEWKQSLDFLFGTVTKDLVEESEVSILLRDKVTIDYIIEKVLMGNMSKMQLSDVMNSPSVLMISAHLEDLLSRVNNRVIQPLRSSIHKTETHVRDIYTTTMEYATVLQTYYDRDRSYIYYDTEQRMRRLQLWRKPRFHGEYVSLKKAMAIFYVIMNEKIVLV